MTKKSKGINATRLKTIYSRQESPCWCTDYLPSILATPQEAPSISRAYILTPQKMQGRETHLLSTPERNAALLGLYHPDVVGLQEQRMLSPEACCHPLSTFMGMDKSTLPHLKGVIDVADRLGMLDLLPRLKIQNNESPNEPTVVIFPWIGDLLWAIKPNPKEIYCMNWSVKNSYQDFKKSVTTKIGKTENSNKSHAVLGRHEIEKVYYEDAEIRTIQVADEAIDHHVSANLRQLFLHHRRDLNLTDEQRSEILQKFRAALETAIPPTDVILFFAEKRKYSVDQTRSLFYQAIWNRQLRVDLFQPVLINRPMHPESRDVLDVYADWFRR